MNSFEYWKECISIAADECGLVITDKQLNELADSVQGGYENFDMAFGYDVASRNWESDESKELKRIKREQDNRRIWVASTKPCRVCTTTGLVRDGWGRDMTCPECNGEGRI